MSNVTQILSFYRRLFNALGVRMGTTKIIILEYFAESGDVMFRPPDLAKVTGITRAETYKHCKDFYELGFLKIYNMPPLPEDFYDWSAMRRRSYKKWVDFPKGVTYSVDVRGVLKSIDEQIEELNVLKEFISTEYGGEDSV